MPLSRTRELLETQSHHYPLDLPPGVRARHPFPFISLGLSSLPQIKADVHSMLGWIFLALPMAASAAACDPSLGHCPLCSKPPW